MHGAAASSEATIVAAGVVTAIGYDLQTACASYRAGIARASKFEDYMIDSGDGAPGGDAVTAHATNQLTDGFEGNVRLLRIAAAALEQLPVTPEMLPSLALYVVIGDCRSEAEHETARELAMRACVEAGWTQVPAIRFIGGGGHCATARCLSELIGSSDRAAFNIVLCVDSLLSERRLGQLESDGALKTDEVPAGLQPAEAGVALLLSSQPDGGIGSIVAIGELDEAPLANPDDVYTGAALDRLLAAAEHKLGPEVGAHPWVISDQNGEAWRAFDWGSALSRLVGRQSPYAATQPWFPAIQFGDTGSVTGAIGIVTALGAFSRHYAPHPVATILDSDANKRTAIMLRAGKAS